MVACLRMRIIQLSKYLGFSYPLTDSDYAQMCTNINPLVVSSDYGIDIYLERLEFVLAKLTA